MSFESPTGRVRWGLAILAMGLMGVVGCQPGGTDGAEELSDEELAAALREYQPLPTDLPPIPVPDALAARNDDTAKEALDLLNQINAFRSADLPGGTPGDASGGKSVLRMKGDGWQRRCDAFACYFTKKKGDMTITWTQLFALPTSWEYFLTWDGCDGEHEYDDFMVEQWHMQKDLKFAFQWHFQYPDPPPCGDGEPAIGPGPLWRRIFEVIDGGVLYVQGQTFYLDTRRYITETYQYDSLLGEYLLWKMLVCTSYPDGRLVFEDYGQRLSERRLLYLWYKGIWTSEHRYCWTTYRENGTVLDCGGDMGCPDCGA
jgi:hypothetical protein